jgi:hypothetical protein
MLDQSVTVNGRAGIFIGRPYNRVPPVSPAETNP